MPSKQLSDPQKTAVWLLQHPAAYGRQLGYKLLRDDLHSDWINKITDGHADMTLQSHRGSYKTTCLVVAITRLILTHRDQNIIFLRKTDDDVAEVLEAVKSALTHPLTQSMIEALTGKPLELYKATSKQIISSLYARPGGAPQLLGIGLGGSLTGKHADVIITDDIVNRLDRQSRAERERTKLIYQELQNLRNPGGRFINTGTPWHKEDAFSLMPTPEKWDCYQTGLLSKQKIEELRMQMAPSLFAANYELRHIASDGALFDTSRPIVPEENEEGVHLLRNGIAHIDAAYGGEDYTAFTCCQMAGGKIYLYGKLWHSHVDTVLNTALAEANRLMCGPVYCELNGDKGYLSKEIRNRGGYAFGYTESQNKYIKISTYLKKWWSNVVFVKGTDPAYIEQIMDFTDSAEHDDAPDSAATCCRIMDGR